MSNNQLNIESVWLSSIKIIEDFELQKKMQMIEKENYTNTELEIKGYQ